MTIEERIDQAVLAADAVAALTDLVHGLHAEGLTKQQIGTAYHLAYRAYQDADRDDHADRVADLLDVLTGWCSPGNRILPDEPDAKI